MYPQGKGEKVVLVPHSKFLLFRGKNCIKLRCIGKSREIEEEDNKLYSSLLKVCYKR